MIGVRGREKRQREKGRRDERGGEEKKVRNER